MQVTLLQSCCCWGTTQKPNARPIIVVGSWLVHAALTAFRLVGTLNHALALHRLLANWLPEDAPLSRPRGCGRLSAPIATVSMPMSRGRGRRLGCASFLRQNSFTVSLRDRRATKSRDETSSCMWFLQAPLDRLTSILIPHK